VGRLLSATTPEAVNEPKQLWLPDAVSPLRVTSLCSAADAGRMQPGSYQAVIESREFFVAEEHGEIACVIMEKRVDV
jgi:hypothetical protein